MIQRANSYQLMQEFHQLQNDIGTIKRDVADMEAYMNTKLEIINMYHTIAQNMAQQIQHGVRTENDIYFSLDADNTIVGGSYDLYGQTIHAPFKAIPEQMFNFITESGPLYKDCASVYLLTEDEAWNQEYGYRYEYNNTLKHESDPSKQDILHMFSGPDVTLRVKLNHTNFYGNTSCNMIEICPYFPGTFDIQQIDIYTVTQHLSEGDEMDIPDHHLIREDVQGNTVPYIRNVGACRFLLDDTYQIYQIDFKLRLHEQQDSYPFGLRHLYFYNAKIDTINDYIVAKISKDRYIESIGDTVTIGGPNHEWISLPAERFGIEYYLAYDNGLLQGKITTSEQLARNVRTVYAKIPLFECLTHIKIDDIEVR